MNTFYPSPIELAALQITNSAQHDAYAPDYDNQVKTMGCCIADLLFGLCNEFTKPGQVLLDIGIGSGLASQLFSRAGLAVHGMDYSLDMLEICQAKGFTVGLKQHDLQQVPWPYQAQVFDFLISCGVFHFIADLENSFGEARRVLREGGLFAFTTKHPPTMANSLQEADRQNSGTFEIFSHSSAYVETLMAQDAFNTLKSQKCFVGDELFILRVVQKTNQRKPK